MASGLRMFIILVVMLDLKMENQGVPVYVSPAFRYSTFPVSFRYFLTLQLKMGQR